MNNIEVKILNPESVQESERMMVCAARLTQRGHTIKNMADFMALYEKGYTRKAVATMAKLPHPTMQKFGVINVVVCGASRRLLAQITRHQNEVKFMSASLQYSCFSDYRVFVTPYEVLEKGEDCVATFRNACIKATVEYKKLIEAGIDQDTAGYLMPQALGNVLIISATPYQWKHMIGQRICRRNTAETRYVMLRIWEQLFELNPTLFSGETTGALCCRSQGDCKEGKFACGKRMRKTIYPTPMTILQMDFPLLMKEANQ